jgi:hypothetical protein
MSAQARRARDRRRAGAGETCAGAHRRGLIGNVLPDATGATAVNKVCGSGMEATPARD